MILIKNCTIIGKRVLFDISEDDFTETTGHKPTQAELDYGSWYLEANISNGGITNLRGISISDPDADNIKVREYALDITEVERAAFERRFFKEKTLSSLIPTDKEIKKRIASSGISIVFQPTERTTVCMMIPCEGRSLKTTTSTGKKLVVHLPQTWKISSTSYDRTFYDWNTVADEEYEPEQEMYAIAAFQRKIRWLIGMYGQSQKLICKWQ